MKLHFSRRELGVALLAAIGGALAVSVYLAVADPSADAQDWLPRYAAGAEIGSDDYSTEGRLFREGNCLYYQLPDAHDEFDSGLLILPEDDGAWDEAVNTLTFEGVTYKVGDKLFVATPSWGVQWDWAQPPDGSCVAPMFWVAEQRPVLPPGYGEPFP